jgi:hypothetical protein
MRKFVILGSALIASAVSAQQTISVDPNEVICRMIRETGSRLAARRQCMTRASWDQQRRQDRALAAEAQIRQVNPQHMTPAEKARALGRYYVGGSGPPRN